MDKSTAGPENFHHIASKRRRREIISAILNSYAPGERVEPGHEQILRVLVQGHRDLEQKLEAQTISHFEVHRCTHGTKCFYIVRSDGKKKPFSYGKCL